MENTFGLDGNKSEFLDSLNKRIIAAHKHARRNYYSAYACYSTAIIASLVATVIAATSSAPKLLLAVITAVPGSALLLNSIVSFEKKSGWYWKKVHYYEGLASRVQYEGQELSGVSKDLRNFDEQMELQYPRFGVLPQHVEKNSQL